MSDLRFLGLEDLLALVRYAQLGPVADLGLLDSSAARPRSSPFGVDAYESVELKAAALLHSIARNHTLVDGNKRLAWLATVVFLDINRYEPHVTDDEAFALVMDAAQGTVELDEIAGRLRVPANEG